MVTCSGSCDRFAILALLVVGSGFEIIGLKIGNFQRERDINRLINK